MADFYVLASSKGEPVSLVGLGLADGGRRSMPYDGASPANVFRAGMVFAVATSRSELLELSSERGFVLLGPVVFDEIPEVKFGTYRTPVLEALGLQTKAKAPALVPPPPPPAAAPAGQPAAGVRRPALSPEQVARLQMMPDFLKQRVRGQDEAITIVSGIVQSSLLDLKEPNKTDGVLLFAGPSGVGKTELAKAVAEFLRDLYAMPYPLVHLKMTDYMERHNAGKLVGTTPGYVGYGEGGVLTNALIQSPCCVVLLDELDKAHSMVMKIFLPVFDEAQLNSGKADAPPVACDQALFIGTANYGSSNIGARKSKSGFQVGDAEGFKENEVASAVDEGIQEHLVPELQGRIDEIIVFKELDDATLKDIAVTKLHQVSERAFARGLRLEFTDAALDAVVAHRRNRQHGARHLDRAIKRLVNPLIRDAIFRMAAEGRLKDAVIIDADSSGKKLQMSDQVKPVLRLTAPTTGVTESAKSVG